MRGRFDTALFFPRRLDTPICTAFTKPQIYSLGPTKLWWFDGQRNYPIVTGAGGGVTGASNGLQVQQQDAIMGYATTMPSLYRSVNVKTGVATFNINADSLYEQTGADTIEGGFVAVGPTNYFNTGFPGADIGMKVSSSQYARMHFDDEGPYISGQFIDDHFSDLFLGDTLFNIDMIGTSGQEFTMRWQPTPTPALPQTFNLQSSGGILLRASDPGSIITTPSTVVLDTDLLVNLPAGSGNGNLFLLDGEQTAHVSRLSVNADEYLNPGGSITAIVNGGLGVPSGPSGYHIEGYNQGFLITFETGAITTGLDSTESIIRLSFTIPAEAGYIVTPVPYNSAAGIAMATVQPYMVPIDNQTFELHGALNNWSSLGFKADTYYTFAFKTVDIGSGTYGSSGAMALARRAQLARLKTSAAPSMRKRKVTPKRKPLHHAIHRGY